MNRVCVIDMPGLSRDLLAAVPGESELGRWMAGRRVAGLTPTFPAVTCSVQASLTTGRKPSEHGIVANGVPTFRSPADQAIVDASNFGSYRKEISFWEQSNQFLESPRFWQGKHKTALLFFQNSMPGFAGGRRPAADMVLTPKPDHGPDGKLTSLCWGEPGDLVATLFGQFGPFPLMNYWGPAAGIAGSQWIARAAAWVWEKQAPRLQWVYVPHLDYDLQRFGPSSPRAAAAVRDAAAAVEPLVEAVTESGGKIVLLSEYAMRDVTACVQPNRLLAEAGLLATRASEDGKVIDYDRSAAVAMVDHQIAHVYCREGEAGAIEKVRGVFGGDRLVKICTPREVGLVHRRCGDLVLQADAAAWFDYRWWAEERDAPVFAKAVDIHRKPGYDPLELFWDRAIGGVSQNTSLVRGSHGLVSEGEAVLVSEGNVGESVQATDVAGIIERMLE